MKRLTVCLVAMAMIVLGAGCQKKAAAPVIGYLCKSASDAFAVGPNSAAREKFDALKRTGVIADWHFYDGLSDPATQITLVDIAIRDGCNYLIFLPVEAVTSALVLEKAKEKNIPIVVVNSRTTNTSELAAAYVGSNDVQAGEMMASYILKQLPAGGGWGHIQGPIGHSAQAERGRGIHAIMDQQPNWKLLDEQPGEWFGESAARFAEDWRAKYGSDLNAIICDNDDMSAAAQTVVNAAGRTDIICIGVDGTSSALSMIKSGDLKATFYQDGIGQIIKAIDLVVELAHGNSIPKESWIDFMLITEENVGKFLK